MTSQHPVSASPPSDFETTFAPLFDPPLEPLDVLHQPTRAELDRYRKEGRPACITGMMDDWPALERWHDPEYLKRLVGDKPVYYRNTHKSDHFLGDPPDIYEQTTFANLVDAVFSDPQSGMYLTQGALATSLGFRRAFRRSVFPAFLPELKADIRHPHYYTRREVAELNIWFGAGGQTSSLHFDEMDNLNCLVLGQKRWLLFPQDQWPQLIPREGRDYGQSITQGFHQGAPGRFREAKRRTAKGFEHLAKPGEMIFVPSGCWHQVFSGPEVNLALNYWCLALGDILPKLLPIYTRRTVGYESNVKMGFAMAIGLLSGTKMLATYGFNRLRGQEPPPPSLGPTSYDR